ncbi:hypothetical protein AOLI_G00085700 [Acnodon oligacanthus]
MCVSWVPHWSSCIGWLLGMYRERKANADILRLVATLLVLQLMQVIKITERELKFLFCLLSLLSPGVIL